MKLATLVGINITEFWEITPFELSIVAKTYGEKEKQKHKQGVELAYYNAMWTIQWLGKKQYHPKPLQETLDNLYKEKKIMSDDDLLKQVVALNRLFGGEEITCNP